MGLWRLLNKPTNFNWVIPNKLACSGLLKAHREFEWALKQGIRSIVTIRETSLLPKYVETKEMECDDIKMIIDYLHIKVQDHDAPDLDVLIKTTDYIDNHIESGKPVLIHCNAGRERKDVLVTAYFMKKEVVSLENALRKVKQLRKTIPHKGKQLDVLKKYESILNNDNKPT